jgi:hypothetical protein
VHGATLCLPSKETTLKSLARRCDDVLATYIGPSTAMLLREPQLDSLWLTRLGIGGEACPPSLALSLAELDIKAVFNHWGVSEVW